MRHLWIEDLQTVTLVGVMMDMVGYEGGVLGITSNICADTVIVSGQMRKTK
jgi:hypothetical protein